MIHNMQKCNQITVIFDVLISSCNLVRLGISFNAHRVCKWLFYKYIHSWMYLIISSCCGVIGSCCLWQCAFLLAILWKTGFGPLQSSMCQLFYFIPKEVIPYLIISVSPLSIDLAFTWSRKGSTFCVIPEVKTNNILPVIVIHLILASSSLVCNDFTRAFQFVHFELFRTNTA